MVTLWLKTVRFDGEEYISKRELANLLRAQAIASPSTAEVLNRMAEDLEQHSMKPL